MPRSKNLPVSSFGPELLLTLKQGAAGPCRIAFATPALATRFRMRVNELRLAMKRENHPDWPQLYRCGAYIDKSDRRVVLLAPRDAEFLSALSAAGIGGSSLQPADPSLPPASEDPADAFLSDLKKDSTP